MAGGGVTACTAGAVARVDFTVERLHMIIAVRLCSRRQIPRGERTKRKRSGRKRARQDGIGIPQALSLSFSRPTDEANEEISEFRDAVFA